MVSLLLPVLYLAFISLGLPDALLGAAWPSMYPQLGAGVSWAGGVSMIISVGTIVSSLASEWLNNKLGTGRVTALSDAPTAEALAAKLHAMRTAELRAGFCLTGPHREDLEILLDGQPARVFGSQGQQRSCVLARKLAEATVVGDLFGEHPVLLLDDVLSELDDERQTYLLTRMGEHQTIVTTCDTAAFARTNGKIVMVKGGVVEEA